MGNICSSNQKKEQKIPIQQNEKIQNIQFGEGEMTFKMIISNVKIKCLPYTESQLLIQIDKCAEIVAPVIEGNSNPHVIIHLYQYHNQWRIYHKIDYYSTQENLQTSFFIMSIYVYKDKVKKLYSKVVEKLWDVAVGPMHYDLSLQSKESSISRITFDIKMFQRVQMKITPRNLRCDLDEQLIERAYTFQMRIKSHKLDYESQMSSIFVNPQQKWLNNQKVQGDIQINHNQMGDLQLLRNNKLYEICDLVDLFDHDQNMDENIQGSIFVFKTTPEKNMVHSNAQLFQNNNRMKKSASNQSLLSMGNIQKQIQSKHGSKTGSQQGFYSIFILLLELQKGISYQQFKSQQKLKGTNGQSTKDELTACKYINWQFKNDAPFIDFYIYVDEFVSSSFELVLWANKKTLEQSEHHKDCHKDNLFNEQLVLSKQVSANQQKQQASDSLSSDDSQMIQLDYKLIGHCFVSMNRFCSKDASLLAQMGRMLVQEIHFDEKLQKHGIAIGNVKGDFIMTNSPFLRQMMGVIKTEYGIQKGTLLYNRNHKFLTKPNQQIQKIVQITIRLDGLVGDENMKDLPRRAAINSLIKVTISDLREQLEISYQNLYENEAELRRAQLILIDLAKQLLESANMLDEELRESYYEILIQLLLRQEFNIAYMGFDKQQRLLLQSGNPENNQQKSQIEMIKQKIQIGLAYQGFLFKTLQFHVIEKISQRGCNQMENAFVYNFLVIAFIRIPEFQASILSFLNQEQRQLGEVFEKQLLEPYSLQVIQNDSFLKSLDWQQCFYDVLCDDGIGISKGRGKQHLNDLKSFLKDIKWSKIVNRQNHILIKMLDQMCKYLQKSKFFIPWNHLPGYGLLIRYFLLELKDADQYPYPDIFKEVSQSLLVNPSLINQLLFVIYNKTRIYDSLQVFYTYDMINFWFSILKNIKKKLPTDFNYHFFYKGVYLIFEGDHALSIAKVLQVFYNIFPQLPNDQQHEFCNYLFDKFFFRFFMSWSKTVRWVFHQFLIYRIQHLFRNLENDAFKIQDLKKDFQYYSARQQSAPKVQNEKDKLLNDKIYLKYTQMVEIILKIKKVLSKNIQQQDSCQLKAHLEARSLRMKFIKMKMRLQNRLVNQNKSPSQESLDFTLQSQRGSLNSLSFRKESASGQAEEQSVISDHSQYSEYVYDDKSLGSIINVEQILQEIAEEKQLKQSRARKGNRQNSVQGQQKIKEMSPVQGNKKVKIYHRLNYYNTKKQKLQIPKDHLRYLILATTEWQEQQMIYKRWFQQRKSEIIRMKVSEDQIVKRLQDLEPPEIYLRVPKDESESNINQDW